MLGCSLWRPINIWICCVIMRLGCDKIEKAVSRAPKIDRGQISHCEMSIVSINISSDGEEITGL